MALRVSLHSRESHVVLLDLVKSKKRNAPSLPQENAGLLANYSRPYSKIKQRIRLYNQAASCSLTSTIHRTS